MERLTLRKQEKYRGERIIANRKGGIAMCRICDEALQTLAAYEDTKLTPAEITAMQAELATLRSAQVTHHCDNCEGMGKELAEYQQAEQEGRLVRTVWCKDCESSKINPYTKSRYCGRFHNANAVQDDHFCSQGKARAAL